ncbi:hypothetical protein [Kitasatospora sp. NPDC093558]|uniref:hypothetical protein n=1 Tax=Kitasatospora sp. NPDC093558 TaxID=3155201 RepID=UPI00343307C7
MLPVHLTLRRDDDAAAPTDADAETLHDALWAHATPDTGLEHVRARAVRQGISVVLYLRARTAPEARQQALRVLDAALAAAPGSHGHSVTLHG